jgi:hypothetical protein
VLFISFHIIFVQMVLLQLFVKLVWFYFNLVPNYQYMVARNISLSSIFLFGSEKIVDIYHL